MINLRVLLFYLIFIPVFVSSQNEDDQIRKFLISIPADLSDDQAISQLKSRNFSKDAKRAVSILSACQIKRYKLALFMLDDGFWKINDLQEFFSVPFSDGSPNPAIISSYQYSQTEIIDFLQKLIDKGIPVSTFAALEVYDKPGYDKVFDFLYGKLSDSDKMTVGEDIVGKMLSKNPVNYSELSELINKIKLKVPGNYFTRVGVGSLDVAKLLVKIGADPAYGTSDNGIHPLSNAVTQNNPEVVAYFLEMGSSACFEDRRGHDALYFAKTTAKYLKTDEEKLDNKKIIEMIKAAKKKC